MRTAALALLLVLCLAPLSARAGQPASCGGLDAGSLVDADPGAYWNALLSSPGAPLGAPWLAGCRPPRLTWQDPFSPARQSLSYDYNPSGRVSSWRWQITDRDGKPRLLTGETNYDGEGRVLTAAGDCPDASGRESSAFTYDDRGRMSQVVLVRPAGCRAAAPEAMDRVEDYFFPRRGESALPERMIVTDRLSGAVRQTRISYTREHRGGQLIQRSETEDRFRGETLSSERYDYDLAGRMVVRAGAVLRRFAYDGGRLSAVDSGTPGAWTITFGGPGGLDQVTLPNPLPWLSPSRPIITLRSAQ
jgi:YD repeat-containing protein